MVSFSVWIKKSLPDTWAIPLLWSWENSLLHKTSGTFILKGIQYNFSQFHTYPPTHNIARFGKLLLQSSSKDHNQIKVCISVLWENWLSLSRNANIYCKTRSDFRINDTWATVALACNFINMKHLAQKIMCWGQAESVEKCLIQYGNAYAPQNLRVTELQTDFHWKGPSSFNPSAMGKESSPGPSSLFCSFKFNPNLWEKREK